MNHHLMRFFNSYLLAVLLGYIAIRMLLDIGTPMCEESYIFEWGHLFTILLWFGATALIAFSAGKDWTKGKRY